MIIETDSFFVPISLALSSIAATTPGFIVGFAFDSIASLVVDAIINFALGTVDSHISFVVIDPNNFFYYGKVIMAKNFTISKLYIKRSI